MSEDQQSRDERMWMQGQRSALLGVVRDSLATLGVLGHKDFTAEKLMLERASVIDALRRLCDEFGDNQWNESDHLGDVIERHLAKYLYEDFVPEDGYEDHEDAGGELPSGFDPNIPDAPDDFEYIDYDNDDDDTEEEPVEHDQDEDFEEDSSGDHGEVVNLWGDVGTSLIHEIDGPVDELERLDEIFESKNGDCDE